MLFLEFRAKGGGKISKDLARWKTGKRVLVTVKNTPAPSTGNHTSESGGEDGDYDTV